MYGEKICTVWSVAVIGHEYEVPVLVRDEGLKKKSSKRFVFGYSNVYDKKKLGGRAVGRGYKNIVYGSGGSVEISYMENSITS